MLYVNPRRPSAELSGHFNEGYIGSTQRVEVDFISYREGSLKRAARRIRNLVPKGGRLLDVGAASGFFLACFSSDPAWQVEGMEPSPVAARYARETFGLKIHDGYLADQKFSPESFDVVTSLDTFYFHPFPNEDLRAISRILKPKGLVVMEIPGLNFRLMKNTGVICRLLYGVPARLNAGLHLYFYSRRTLSLLMEKHGFSRVASFPEQAPVYGSLARRFLNSLYFTLTGLLYNISGGYLNLAPKELIVFRKEKDSEF